MTSLHLQALCAKKRLQDALRKLLQQKQQRSGTQPNTSDDVTSGSSHDIFTDILRATCFSNGNTTHSDAAGDRGRQEAETAAIDQALELLFGGQETLSCLITCLVMLLAPSSTGGATHDDDELTVGENPRPRREASDGERMESCSRGQQQPVFDKMFAEVGRRVSF